MKQFNKTCSKCLRKEKVFLVDLNVYNERGGRIKFKQCKKRTEEHFSVILLLDKIVIKL